MEQTGQSRQGRLKASDPRSTVRLVNSDAGGTLSTTPALKRKWDTPLGSDDKTSLAARDYNSLMRSMQRRASGVSA